MSGEMPFCKMCKHMVVRDADEWAEEVREWWFGGQQGPDPTARYYGCDHTVARKLSNGFVGCSEMRNMGRPCSPEGLLYELNPDWQDV
jgi:hypothetical protein